MPEFRLLLGADETRSCLHGSSEFAPCLALALQTVLARVQLTFLSVYWLQFLEEGQDLLRGENRLPFLQSTSLHITLPVSCQMNVGFGFSFAFEIFVFVFLERPCVFLLTSTHLHKNTVFRDICLILMELLWTYVSTIQK